MLDFHAFGDELSRLRKGCNFTQRDLASKVGVTFTYLSKIEGGKVASPREEVIINLARALNTDEHQLLTLGGKNVSDSARILKERILKEFGPKMRGLRLETGLSLRQFAREAGLAPPT